MNYFSDLKMKKTVNEIKKYYENEKLAKDYINSRFNRPLGRLIHHNQISFINKFIRDKKISSVIDVATGPGRISKDVYGFKYGLAVDNSKAMLKIANVNLNGRFNLKVVDVFKMNIGKKFDLVYSFKFIRHFDISKRRILYKSIKKLMSRNSYLIFDVPNGFIYKWHTKHYPSPVYDEFWTKKTIIKELEDNEFTVVSLVNNINHFKVQEFISKFSKIKILTYTLYLLLRLIELVPSSQPYEWIAVAKIK